MPVELMDMLFEYRSSPSDRADDDVNCRNSPESSNDLSAGRPESGNQSSNSPQAAHSELRESESVTSSQTASQTSTSFPSGESESDSTTEMATATQVSPLTLTTAATVQASTLIAQNPLVKSFIFGSFSGTCSTILFQPFDLLKTRQQSPQLKSQNFLRLSWNIIRDEKPIGLWRGTVPSLIRSVPGIGLYFCSMNALERTFCKQEKNGRRASPNALQAAAFGLTARCSVGLLLMPATVIKTRLESGLFDYHDVSRAFSSILRAEGVRGLYTGLTATLMRDAPFSSLYYMFYSQLRKLVEADQLQRVRSANQTPLLSQSATSFLCGVMAGFAASIVTQPPDVIKTHMQLQPDRYRSIRLTTVAIVQEHGLAGLFRGIVPRMIRRTMMASLAWTVYDTFARQYNMK